jgi:hypothetical protein
MFKKLFTHQNAILAFGIPYGIFLNYVFFKNVFYDVDKNKNLKIIDKLK